MTKNPSTVTVARSPKLPQTWLRSSFAARCLWATFYGEVRSDFNINNFCPAHGRDLWGSWAAPTTTHLNSVQFSPSCCFQVSRSFPVRAATWQACSRKKNFSNIATLVLEYALKRKDWLRGVGLSQERWSNSRNKLHGKQRSGIAAPVRRTLSFARTFSL